MALETLNIKNANHKRFHGGLVTVIRPHRSDRMRTLATKGVAWWVCLSVCMPVCWSRSWALQNGWTDRNFVWGSWLAWVQGTVHWNLWDTDLRGKGAILGLSGPLKSIKAWESLFIAPSPHPPYDVFRSRNCVLRWYRSPMGVIYL